MFCNNQQITTSVKLSQCLLATLGLIIVHSIHLWKLVWGCQLPAPMHMHGHKRGMAYVRQSPYPAVHCLWALRQNKMPDKFAIKKPRGYQHLLGPRTLYICPMNSLHSQPFITFPCLLMVIKSEKSHTASCLECRNQIALRTDNNKFIDNVVNQMLGLYLCGAQLM